MITVEPIEAALAENNRRVAETQTQVRAGLATLRRTVDVIVEPSDRRSRRVNPAISPR